MNRRAVIANALRQFGRLGPRLSRAGIIALVVCVLPSTAGAQPAGGPRPGWGPGFGAAGAFLGRLNLTAQQRSQIQAYPEWTAVKTALEQLQGDRMAMFKALGTCLGMQSPSDCGTTAALTSAEQAVATDDGALTTAQMALLVKVYTSSILSSTQQTQLLNVIQQLSNLPAPRQGGRHE